MESMLIQSRNGPYRVHFELELDDALVAAAGAGDVWLLVDEIVAEQNSGTIASHFTRSDRVLRLPAIEVNKSFERTGSIFAWLLSTGFRRDSILVAMGGGIIQDVACFVATVLIRGVVWKFIPTTLLAQCDSCIGAKSSINVDRFKNQLGSFHAPADIYIVPKLLDTLPDEALRSGFGEIVKFHLVDSVDSWRKITKKIFWNDRNHLSRLVRESLEIKRRYIEADEYDRGIRNLLNYGHTFGHAFETASFFSIPHGLAVSLGISAATYISERMGLVYDGHFQEVDKVLRLLHGDMIDLLRESSLEIILAAMGNDKKNVGGAAFVILTRGPGCMEKIKVDLEVEIRPLLVDYISQL